MNEDNRIVSNVFYVLIIFSLGILIGESRLMGHFFSQNAHKEKLNQLIDIIDNEYFKTINTDSILDETIVQILKKLDPHSVYISKADEVAAKESISGSFVGIGVQYRTVRDSIAIVRVLKGSPAENSGLRAGDRIIVANKDTFLGKRSNSSNIQKVLKGKRGTLVNVDIYRKQTREHLHIPIKRGDIPLESVESAFLLPNGLAYLKISNFSKTTHQEFVAQMQILKKAGAKALALDLCDNPGGLLEAAVAISDEFLPKGKVIVTIKQRSGSGKNKYATSGGLFEGKPLYVLINERSASASEIVAGAIQDNDAGVIVGRRSFGKGLVQRDIGFADGSSVRLTVAEYLTPTGRNIQRSYKEGNEAYYNDYLNRLEKDEYNTDSINTSNQKRYKTPKGRTVYGGGGISPDVFVPKPPSLSSSQRLVRVLMQDFVFQYLDKDRSRYSMLSEENFTETTVVEDALRDDFVDYVKAETNINVRLHEDDKVVRDLIKANIALQLYGVNAFERLTAAYHDEVRKAEELWQNKHTIN